MKFLKKYSLLAIFAVFVAAPIVTVATPAASYAIDVDTACNTSLLGVPAWYNNLSGKDADGECTVVEPDKVGGLEGFIWKIVLNVINMALVLIAYIAAFFIIFAGFQYLTGGDQPGKVEKAKQTLMNAVIGLAISMASIAIINLVFGIIN